MTETFMLNKPPRVCEETEDNFERKNRGNLKEDAENLKIYVRKVSNTIHENMDGIQAKKDLDWKMRKWRSRTERNTSRKID